MKAILAGALIVALGIASLSLWGRVHEQRMAVSSSQIFIHGTPVCVMQHAGEISASVGICGASGGESREGGPEDGDGIHGGTPSPLVPRHGLPPGHPPVDPPPPIEGGRMILI